MRQWKISLSFLLFAQLCCAQLQVKNFFSFSGKKDVEVTAITQDETGFLWLGTNTGIFKFDAKEAEEVVVGDKILKQAISALFVDKNQTLWIGTKSGKIYTLRKNKLDSLNFGSEANAERITAFCEFKDGLCAGTYGNGLYLIQNKTIRHITTQTNLCDNVVYALESDKNDHIWCGTDAGIAALSNLNQKQPLVESVSAKNGLPDNIVRNIYYYSQKLIVSMQDSGVCSYDLAQRKFSDKLLSGPWSSGAVIKAIENDGKLMIATEKNGLFEMDNTEIRNYDYSAYLQTTSINGLFTDNTGQIWLFSKKGISHLLTKKYSLSGNIKELNDNNILAVVTDKENEIWVGTARGINKIENGSGNTMRASVEGISERYTISCAAKAPDGTVWYGSYGNGIIIYNSKSKKTEVINSKNSSLSNDNISSIFFGKDGNALVSTLGGGLMIIKPLKEDKIAILHHYTENDGLGNNYVYAAITDNNNNLFVGSDGGGLQLLQQGKFSSLTQQFKFQSNTIYSLCRDKYNTVWAVSDADGVLKYSKNKLTAINKSNGIRDMQPQQIITVDNVLYAFNTKGVDKINCITDSVTYYDIFENETEPNLNAVCYSNGKIISGTNKGVLIYRTSILPSDTIKPTAYIKSLQVNFKRYPLDSVTEFKYRQNNMAIEFNGVWLKSPDKLTFRYKLSGMEENWQSADYGKTINYNNLAPGEYTFLLQSKNEEDVWSNPVQYHFTILTPIWKRVWFWPLIIAIISISVYIFFKYRLRSLKKQNLLLEQKVTERTKEIEEQARVIETKNKDITDSITYARKIQHSILPNDRLIKQHLPQSFILYLTKDIVSGDFYWFGNFGEFSIIAAIDCTGHGVPGAFMSMIGNSLLNRIINEKDISHPSDILLELNEGVLNVLHKNESESKDGMDIAICKIYHTQKKIEYAGAMRPLWLIGKEGLTEIKADKIPIGVKPKDLKEPIKFTTHTFQANEGDRFYIFTDGYADQFGGTQDKKFSTRRFKELLGANTQLDFESQKELLKNQHLSWKGSNEQVDDILIIGFSV